MELWQSPLPAELRWRGSSGSSMWLVLTQEGLFRPKTNSPPFFSLSESFITAPVRNKLDSICTAAPRQTSQPPEQQDVSCHLFFCPPLPPTLVKLCLLHNSCCFCQCSVTPVADSWLTVTVGGFGPGEGSETALPVKVVSGFFMTTRIVQSLICT